MSSDGDTDQSRGTLWRYVVNEQENNKSQLGKFSTQISVRSRWLDDSRNNAVQDSNRHYAKKVSPMWKEI